MKNATLAYPIILDQAGITRLIPHRGEFLFAQHISIKGPHTFDGIARWPLHSGAIQGHFPGMHVVPGVLLVEGMAQLAGAGLLAGDPYVRSLTGDWIGVLAGIRKSVFKHPVRPDTDVHFTIRCRQMAPLAVQVNAVVGVGDKQVAELDIFMAYVDRQVLAADMV